MSLSILSGRSNRLGCPGAALVAVLAACSSDDASPAGPSAGGSAAGGQGGGPAGGGGQGGGPGCPEVPDGNAGAAGGCPAAGPAYDQPGPWPVGHEVFTVDDGARQRQLTVQVWYPAAEAGRAAAEAGVPVEELVPDAARRAQVASLVAGAPERCTSRRTRSAPGLAAAGGGGWPLVVFSHCHGCVRFSSFTVAERLASHGIAVAAADHAGGDLYAQLDGTISAVNADFLAVRVGDVRAVLDVLLAGGDGVPAPVRGRLDAGRVGMMGHSFGAVTTGKILVDDDRFRAGFAMAAPPAFLGGVKMEQIAEPTMMLLAREDHSIGALGNGLIRDNFAAATSPSWLAEVADAGHWSFSDLCALVPAFTPGCGAGKRQDDKTVDFTYLDIDQGRALASAYATAFFAWALRGEERGKTYLGGNHPADVVAVTAR